MLLSNLPVKTKLLFSTGDLSSTLTLAIQTFFQMYFLTDVARIPPATVGWIVGICGPGIATAAVIPWSMLPDVIEVEQQASGERREGAYYSFVSFLQKLGTGAAFWGIGQSLALVGYVTPTDLQPFPVQPESAFNAIRIIIGPATIGLLLISLPFAWWYPISRKSHHCNLERIRGQE